MGEEERRYAEHLRSKAATARFSDQQGGPTDPAADESIVKPDQERLIAASTLEQAKIAAERLALDRDEWRYLGSARDLWGITRGTEIFLALPPPLEAGRSYHELRTAMQARRLKIKEVWT